MKTLIKLDGSGEHSDVLEALPIPLKNKSEIIDEYKKLNNWSCHIVLGANLDK